MFDFIKKQQDYSTKSNKYEECTNQFAVINTRLNNIFSLSNIIARSSQEAQKLKNAKAPSFTAPSIEMFFSSFFSSLTLLTAFITIFYASVTLAEEEKKKEVNNHPPPLLLQTVSRSSTACWQRLYGRGRLPKNDG
ncbi:hypothetical protein Megpolyxen_00362 [Candidatus Megaera polyxenophila]|nr:hypothetical protein Megpolyxen_00362 [Candidatus Megaera polyxenophila]